MIDVVNVTQHYGVRPVLREINLRIERGQLIAILGPNGIESFLAKSDSIPNAATE